ncbi:hypothetical protein AcV7_004954 [Taiwanofungus camphoratus]|nr:hypothetical protein AcV7_004954 [Antrodia cinnamomea]
MSNSREYPAQRLDPPSRSRSRRRPSANPDASIDDEASERGHPDRHDSEQTLVEEPRSEADKLQWSRSLPWWKRPSPWWFVAFIPLTAVAMSATAAPRIEIYIQLICEAYKPEYTGGQREMCSSDPTIQAAVAKLALAMTASMGVLGCLTTAWWGSLSDRYGRTRVMSCAAIGLLCTDFDFILVSKFWKVLPGGYWFLICGPVIEGLLGGMNLTTAAINAYAADCTDNGSRSRIFSLFMGLLFAGMSLGPTLGSLIISLTGRALSVFYAAAVVHVVYALCVWFVIPESLSESQMAETRGRHADEAGRGSGGAGLGRLLSFLAPLALFVPTAVEDNPLKKGKRDWSLVLLAAGYGMAVTIKGSSAYKMQYLSLAFGWSAEEIGYWSSILSVALAVHLTVILPTIIKFFQPKPPAIQLPVEQDEPLHPSASSSSSSSPLPSTKASRPSLNQTFSPTFDLAVARISLAIGVVSYILMTAAPNGYVFTVYTVFSAFSMGYSPATNSVASALYTRSGGKELGRLFGALAVVQTICSQIVGPFLFGVTYMKTVATFPSAIYLAAAGMLGASLVLFSCVSLQSARVFASSTDMEDRTPANSF